MVGLNKAVRDNTRGILKISALGSVVVRTIIKLLFANTSVAIFAWVINFTGIPQHEFMHFSSIRY